MWPLSDTGDAHWSPTDPVPRSAACQSPSSALGLAASIRKGGDTLGRLPGTPLVTWEAPSSIEGGHGCYTHLLHVDL